jgi:hypothetical protein
VQGADDLGGGVGVEVELPGHVGRVRGPIGETREHAAARGGGHDPVRREGPQQALQAVEIQWVAHVPLPTAHHITAREDGPHGSRSPGGRYARCVSR